MKKLGTREIWINLTVSGALFSIVTMYFLVAVVVSAYGKYVGWEPYRWVVYVGFFAPIMALSNAWFVLPIGLLYGAIMGVISRTTVRKTQWILRGALVGSLCTLCSYLTVSYSLLPRVKLGSMLMLMMCAGIVSGMAVAWFTYRLRPGFNKEQSPNRAPSGQGSSVKTLLVYGLLGPLIGVVIFVALGGFSSGNAQNIRYFVSWSSKIWVLVIALSPLLIIHGFVTGVICGHTSRSARSTGRWHLSNLLFGGCVTGLSLLTILSISLYVAQRSDAGPAVIMIPVGLVLSGAIAAFLCGLICLPFRPRNPA